MPNAGDSGVYAFTHEAPDRHDAAMAGIAIDDDRKVDTLGDPARDLHALSHRRSSDVRKAGIRADDPASADESGLTACVRHDPRVRRSGRVQDRKHLVLPVYELLQAFGFFARDIVSHAVCCRSYAAVTATSSPAISKR